MPSHEPTGGTWHRIYYALGAFNVVSVVIAIALSYRAMAGFSASIAVNEAWAVRVGDYAALGHAASAADAPGNDVFESGDLEGETARLAEARRAFETSALAAATELASEVPFEVRAPLEISLARARAAFSRMMLEAEQIFAAFRRHDRESAGRHMAAMDRQFSATSSFLAQLVASVRALQQAQFVGQEAESASLRAFQYVLVVLVLLIVAAVVAYGRKLARVFATHQALIASKNRDMRLVLDHAIQGFLTIDLDGVMANERSAAADRWFGAPAPGTTLCTHLGDECAVFCQMLALGLDELRAASLPLELVLEQLPRRFVRTGSTYDVTYTPVATSDQTDRLLVMITDVTERLARERAEAEQREMLYIFQQISVDRAGVEEFLLEAGTLVTELRTQQDPVVQKRLVHTLKGNCAVYGLTSYVALAQDIESELAGSEAGLTPAQRMTLVELWRETMKRVAELLGGARRGTVEIDVRDIAMARLSASPELATMLDSWSREPVARRFERLAIQVKATAQRVGKPAPRIDIRGSGIRLDADGWTSFWAAMVHVVRNSIDHGIESEEERVLAGKSPMGNLTMEAGREQGQFMIKIRDDGRGIDWERVRERARRLGLPCDTRRELADALFHDGVSTRDQVSELSGRGVGLSALADVVAELGGRIAVDSEPSRGTTMTFWFPEAVIAHTRERQRARSSLIPQFS